MMRVTDSHDGAATSRLTVAIVGRPNVGKSTLFNRLLGKQAALVDDSPGVTRDRREAIAAIHGYDVRLIDMAGWEAKRPQGEIAAKMQQQIETALANADIALLILDGKAGLLPDDRIFAKKLFVWGKRVHLLINKMESVRGEAGLAEFAALGFEVAFPISAAHGHGIAALKAGLAESAAAHEADDAHPKGETPIHFVMMGRPNVGKSTLINRLVGDERVIVSDQAGTTRDSVAVHWQWQGQSMTLFDTAGLRRRSRITAKLERLSAADALKAICFAQIVALIVDAAEPLERQELRLARHVSDEGRALMILVNKWDTIKDKKAVMRHINDTIKDALPMLRNLPVITLSALQDKDFSVIPDTAFALYQLWCRRVSTAQLNQWLAAATMRHTPPLVRGRRLKLRYITQIKARPPTFHLFASAPVPESYQRYLKTALREDFDWHGVPLRFIIRRSDNPYAPQKKSGRTRAGRTGKR